MNPLDSAGTATKATSTLIPVEEYLKAVYRPDCEYTDGVVEERNLGEFDHGYVQGNISSAIKARSSMTGLVAIPEWRLQLSPTRFRVPDVVITQGKLQERILTKPPLLCVEILSPEDRVTRVGKRVQEYLDFGVPTVWLVDLEAKTITIYRPGQIETITGKTIRVDGTNVEIPLSEIFD